MIRWITFAACSLMFVVLLTPARRSAKSGSNKSYLPNDLLTRAFPFTTEGPKANDIHIKWRQKVRVEKATGDSPTDSEWKVDRGNNTAEMDLSVKNKGKDNLDAGGNLVLIFEPLGDPPSGTDFWDLVESYQWSLDGKKTYQDGDQTKNFKVWKKPPPDKEEKNSTPGGGAKAAVQTNGGLQIATFDTPQGRVKVSLPDDMRAGDTISGTVIAEPKIDNKLKDVVFRLTTSPDHWSGSDLNVKIPLSTAVTPFTFNVPKGPADGASRSPLIIFPWVVAGDPGRVDVAWYGSDKGVPINSSRWGDYLSTDFSLPSMGQQGRPVEIFGPFDGNSSNTNLRYGPAGSTVQDFEKNTENVSGGFGLIRPLAESPRKIVCEAPTNVTGPIELNVKEGTGQATGTFRNVGVNLTAPKTSLLKGESTELHVEVNGLQGIKEPVPLTLQSNGVITMEGGMYQPLWIQPSQVGADGRYTTTRRITGVQTGGWTSTATVVTQPFNIVLRDPDPPQTILVNSFTGDYVFCASGLKLTGTGQIKRAGCVLTLTDNRTDRQVQGTLNSCVPVDNGGLFTFYSLGANTEIKVTVTDTQPPRRRIYFNPLGRSFAPVQDVSAFATCP